LSGPVGLAFDSQGNLYAANQNNNTIEKFGTNGVGSVFASSGLASPQFMAFDNSDNLYVANAGSSTIEKFDTNGNGSVFSTVGSDPSGVAFDSSGNLYVSLFGGFTQVFKVDSSGHPSLFASGVRAADLVIEVPEPASGALVILSIGALLCVHRFRRGSS
jgi:DNA-binding beta-propeller fold protein YncE